MVDDIDKKQSNGNEDGGWVGIASHGHGNGDFKFNSTNTHTLYLCW